MIYCYQANCEKDDQNEICCKCCDEKYECEYTCHHVFKDEDFCLSEVRVDKDEWTTKASIK